MIVLVIAIIIIAIIVILLLSEKKIIEGYDARYTTISFSACAEFCKKTSGCNGFGYNKANNTCYPSQLPILGQPLDSIFKSEYSYGNATCNKIKAIDIASKTPSFEARRSNSVYVCSESHDKHPQYYFHNKGEFKNIGEGRNIDNIFEVENYEVKPYNWPRNKFDYNQLDLLAKERENQTFVPENVTDIDRIVNYVPPKQEMPIILVKPKVNAKPTLDFKLENVKNNAYAFMKKVAPSFLVPTSKYEVKSEASVDGKDKEKSSIRNKYITYKENNNYNTGKYMLDHKCTKDIPLKSCLSYCSNNDTCAGVEWNSLFAGDSQSVCCPYSSVGEYIERKDDKKLGKFYEKQTTYELSKQNDYIVD